MTLAARITRQASQQTYYTIRFLVDRERVQQAYQAYAYFRWVDDILDNSPGTQDDKLEFIHRQQTLLEACYRQDAVSPVHPEEQMLVELVSADHELDSGLRKYLFNMMSVMAFDASRRGRAISHAELTEYTHWLAVAVTEAMFYFIGHDQVFPADNNRYHAVSGAHVVHMLRDTLQDVAAGYFNVPAEYMRAQNISLDDLADSSYRRWVCTRVRLARQYFQGGRHFLRQVKSLRCRLACLAYLARFEWMLHIIERDGFCLRPGYPERKSLPAALWMGWRTISGAIRLST